MLPAVKSAIQNIEVTPITLVGYYVLSCFFGADRSMLHGHFSIHIEKSSGIRAPLTFYEIDLDIINSSSKISFE